TRSVRKRRAQPDGIFLEHGVSPPAPPPHRPDRPSLLAGLDADAAAMLLPPPRPDHVPEAVSSSVRRYVRRPVTRHMAGLFGILLVGVVVGLESTIGQS